MAGNSLADSLQNLQEDLTQANAEKTAVRLAAVEEKRERQQAGDPIPTDKTAL